MTNECSNAVQLKKSLQINDEINVSSNTVRRALKRNGLSARIKRKKPLLSKNIMKIGLNLLRDLKTGQQGETLKDAHIKPTVKFGGDSVFVWGCFTSSDVGFLCKIDGGLDVKLYRQILSEDFMETLRYYDLSVSDIIFQQDNDLKYTALLTKQWFENNNVEVLPALNVTIRGKDALWEHVSQIWNEITLETCTKLIKSMLARIQDVINAKGGYTRW
ncbi:unnamed protein product [Rhizophagus irregularis]|nr:unnamed protein product [Rhizophagus irregularis]